MARRKEPTHVGFDMTPMIDCVFNLIVFFMLVSEFTKAKLVRLELPEPTPQIVEVKEDPLREILNVTAAYDPQMDAYEVDRITWDGNPYTEKEVPDLLKHLQSIKGGKLEVELRADRRLMWGAVAGIMMDCGAADVRKIHFVGKKK